MCASKDPEPKLLTFDDIIHTNPLLFRLHSPKSSHTFFDDDSMILFASRNGKKCKEDSKEIFPTLKALKEKEYPTPYERGAVARHITSWCEHNEDPSDFISLTYNFWYVLWEWKSRRARQLLWGRPNVPAPEDDFQVIVFKSSGLKGRAKLGTEVVDKKEEPRAYNFTQAQDEVIVADFIEPPTVLGAMSCPDSKASSRHGAESGLIPWSPSPKRRRH